MKNLFKVPEGKKITEKMFTRVLAASVCSMLVWMACLVGTTWALFTVSVENTGNVIQIATATADVSVVDSSGNAVEAPEGKYTLGAGTYTITVRADSDAAEWSRSVYVVMSVNDSGYYYMEFTPNSDAREIIMSCHDAAATVGFSVSWVAPAAAEEAGDEIAVGNVQTEAAAVESESDSNEEPSADAARTTRETESDVRESAE